MAEAQILAGLSFLLLTSSVAAKTQQVNTSGNLFRTGHCMLGVAGDMWKRREADESEPQNQAAQVGKRQDIP